MTEPFNLNGSQGTSTPVISCIGSSNGSSSGSVSNGTSAIIARTPFQIYRDENEYGTVTIFNALPSDVALPYKIRAAEEALVATLDYLDQHTHECTRYATFALHCASTYLSLLVSFTPRMVRSLHIDCIEVNHVALERLVQLVGNDASLLQRVRELATVPHTDRVVPLSVLSRVEEAIVELERHHRQHAKECGARVEVLRKVAPERAGGDAAATLAATPHTVASADALANGHSLAAPWGYASQPFVDLPPQKQLSSQRGCTHDSAETRLDAREYAASDSLPKEGMDMCDTLTNHAGMVNGSTPTAMAHVPDSDVRTTTVTPADMTSISLPPAVVSSERATTTTKAIPSPLTASSQTRVDPSSWAQRTESGSPGLPPVTSPPLMGHEGRLLRPRHEEAASAGGQAVHDESARASRQPQRADDGSRGQSPLHVTHEDEAMSKAVSDEQTSSTTNKRTRRQTGWAASANSAASTATATSKKTAKEGAETVSATRSQRRVATTSRGVLATLRCGRLRTLCAAERKAVTTLKELVYLLAHVVATRYNNLIPVLDHITATVTQLTETIQREREYFAVRQEAMAAAAAAAASTTTSQTVVSAVPFHTVDLAAIETAVQRAVEAFREDIADCRVELDEDLLHPIAHACLTAINHIEGYETDAFVPASAEVLQERAAARALVRQRQEEVAQRAAARVAAREQLAEAQRRDRQWVKQRLHALVASVAVASYNSSGASSGSTSDAWANSATSSGSAAGAAETSDDLGACVEDRSVVDPTVLHAVSYDPTHVPGLRLFDRVELYEQALTVWSMLVSVPRVLQLSQMSFPLFTRALFLDDEERNGLMEDVTQRVVELCVEEQRRESPLRARQLAAALRGRRWFGVLMEFVSIQSGFKKAHTMEKSSPKSISNSSSSTATQAKKSNSTSTIMNNNNHHYQSGRNDAGQAAKSSLSSSAAGVWSTNRTSARVKANIDTKSPIHASRKRRAPATRHRRRRRRSLSSSSLSSWDSSESSSSSSSSLDDEDDDDDDEVTEADEQEDTTNSQTGSRSVEDQDDEEKEELELILGHPDNTDEGGTHAAAEAPSSSADVASEADRKGMSKGTTRHATEEANHSDDEDDNEAGEESADEEATAEDVFKSALMATMERLTSLRRQATWGGILVSDRLHLLQFIVQELVHTEKVSTEATRLMTEQKEMRTALDKALREIVDETRRSMTAWWKSQSKRGAAKATATTPAVKKKGAMTEVKLEEGAMNHSHDARLKDEPPHNDDGLRGDAHDDTHVRGGDAAHTGEGENTRKEEHHTTEEKDPQAEREAIIRAAEAKRVATCVRYFNQREAPDRGAIIEPLGSDRYRRLYWYFPLGKCIYVQTPTAVAQSETAREMSAHSEETTAATTSSSLHPTTHPGNSAPSVAWEQPASDTAPAIENTHLTEEANCKEEKEHHLVRQTLTLTRTTSPDTSAARTAQRVWGVIETSQLPLFIRTLDTRGEREYRLYAALQEIYPYLQKQQQIQMTLHDATNSTVMTRSRALHLGYFNKMRLT